MAPWAELHICEMCTQCDCCREACPLEGCRKPYRMQAVGDPERLKTNPRPKWAVPEEVIEWQPSYVQRGAFALNCSSNSSSARVLGPSSISSSVRVVGSIEVIEWQPSHMQAMRPTKCSYLCNLRLHQNKDVHLWRVSGKSCDRPSAFSICASVL